MSIMLMKRTTLILEEACMEGVRTLARWEKRQISHVVNELLVEGLQRRRQKKAKTPFHLPSYPMGVPRVNLGDRNALEALMDSLWLELLTRGSFFMRLIAALRNIPLRCGSSTQRPRTPGTLRKAFCMNFSESPPTRRSLSAP